MHPSAGIALAGLLSISLLAGCFSYKEVSLLEVKAVQVSELTAEGIAVTGEVTIENPNRYRITARDPDVLLYLNGMPIGKAVLDSVITLERMSTRTYRVPMHAQFSGGVPLIPLMLAAARGEVTLRAQGTIKGRVGLINRRFPFDWEQPIQFAPMDQ